MSSLMERMGLEEEDKKLGINEKTNNTSQEKNSKSMVLFY